MTFRDVVFIFITMARAICFTRNRPFGILLISVALLTFCGITSSSSESDHRRVLVIAPHCDDETLSCGGVMSRLASRGASVRVVIVTNGDGFSHPVKDLKRGPAGFIELGHMRQKESLAALEKLGVPGPSVAFLGYPDRGLAMMWMYFWSPAKLYKSRYTRCSYSPYERTFHPNASYCGRSLLSDLEVILNSYRPTTVYYPHPLDIHTDHWAVNCFVTQALYDTGMLDKVESCLYVVHGAYKLLPEELDSRQAPSAVSPGKGWHEVRLSESESETKHSAISEYKTQLPVMGKFLLGFNKDREVFGSEVVCATAKVNDTEWPDWDEVPASIVDQTAENRVAGAIPSGHITSLKCCYSDKQVYLQARLAHRPSKWLAYRFSLAGMPDATAGRANIRVTREGCSGSGARGRMQGSTVEIAVPRSKLGEWEALMVSVDTSIFRQKVDRTSWQVLVPRGKSKPLPGPQAAQDPQSERTSPARRSP